MIDPRLRETQMLLDELLDGGGNETQLLRLEEIISRDAAARRYYIEHMGLVVDLGTERNRPSREETSERQPAASASRGRWVMPTVAVLAVLSLTAGWLTLKAVRRPAETAPLQTDRRDYPSASPPVARLVEAHRARFSDGFRQVGDAFTTGIYRLTEGAVILELQNGVELGVESPSDFEIVSDMKAVLHRGRVRAHVPESGIGFTIAVPDMEIEDLGTEFGVYVAEDRATELHVFTGEVNLRRPGEAPEKLAEGMASRWDAGERRDLAQPDDRAFCTRSSLGFRRWQALGKQLRADPSTVFYFDVERDPAKPELLTNNAASGRAIDGTIVGASWVSGRWSEKGALEFEKDGDRVELNVPGEFQEFTLSAWLYVTRLDLPIQTVLNCRGYEPGTHHWQIRRDGSLDVAIKGCFHPKTAPAGAVATGQWTHLVAVVSQRQRTAHYYVNGLSNMTVNWNSQIPCTFGPCAVALWDSTGYRTSPHARQGGVTENRIPWDRGLRGRLDHLALFSRAFSADEIARIHTAGAGFE